MAKPNIAAKEPAGVEVEAKEYWWCACGQSKNQPFCDGSHKGTEFRPVQVAFEEPQMVYFCRCKHSGNAPFCDGTHTSL